ncbi:MAG: hypothetical protein ACLF0G_00650 [Candidatus Brocadiia bacterium]
MWPGCRSAPPPEPAAGLPREALAERSPGLLEPWQRYDGPEIGEVARIQPGYYRQPADAPWTRGDIVLVAVYDEKQPLLDLRRDNGSAYSPLWADFPKDYSAFRKGRLVARLRAVRAFAYRDAEGRVRRNDCQVSRRDFTARAGTLFVECRVVGADQPPRPGDRVRLASRRIPAPLADDQAPDPAQPRERLAVVPIRSVGVDERTASALTVALEAELHQTGRFVLAERTDIQRVLETHRLQAGQLFDREQRLSQVGKALGVRAIVVGRVERVGETYVAALKVVDVNRVVTRAMVKRLARSSTPDELLRTVYLLARDLEAALRSPQAALAPAR